MEDQLSGTDTYIAHEDLLGGSEVPLDLTVHGVQDDDAIVREDIEHVPHTEAWEEQTQPWLCTPVPSGQLLSRVMCHAGQTHPCGLAACGIGTKCRGLVKVM